MKNITQVQGNNVLCWLGKESHTATYKITKSIHNIRILFRIGSWTCTKDYKGTKEASITKFQIPCLIVKICNGTLSLESQRGKEGHGTRSVAC